MVRSRRGVRLGGGGVVLLVAFMVWGTVHSHRVEDRHKRELAAAEQRTVELVNADKRAGLFPEQGAHTDRNREILVLAYQECNTLFPAKSEKVWSLGGFGMDDHDSLQDDKVFPPSEPKPDDLDLARTGVLRPVLATTRLCERRETVYADAHE
jgi:hypothetical protein